MKIEQLMKTDVAVCRPDDKLSEAARLMWERDCGSVVVADSESDVLRGIITDRDICMASYTKGQPLDAITVGEAMSEDTEACQPQDDIAAAHERMRKHQIRRVPVIKGDDRCIIGIVSLNDLALSAAESKGQPLLDVATTLAHVCRHRPEARR